MRIDAPVPPSFGGPPAPGGDRVRDAATQFEALVIAQLLKGAGTSWTGGEDATASHMLEFAQEQMASALSAAGGLGLASMVVAGLERPPPSAPPATPPPAGTGTGGP
jgi:Rod binding domain-containing protein